MKTLHDHETNHSNRDITITADEPDASNGNASHNYTLSYAPVGLGRAVQQLSFQHGPIAEAGVNGITHEALLAVLLDRLRGFQSSAFACRENALALTKLEEALHWLQARTRARELRGVEGTHAL
jgi:hypothetical protein